MSSQGGIEETQTQLTPSWEDAQGTDPIPFERPKKFKPKHNHITRLLLPQERSQENPPEEKPKTTPRAYTRRSRKIRSEIRYAQSIVDSINALDHSILFTDLENDVFGMSTDWIGEEEEDLSVRARKACMTSNDQTDDLPTLPNPIIEKSATMPASSVSKQDLEAILAGELPLPSSKEDTDKVHSIQHQLDMMIVEKLPSVFWGSRFYIPSATVGKSASVGSARLPSAKEDVLHTLVNIANHKEPRIMQVVHTRFSRKRSERYLSELISSFSGHVHKTKLLTNRVLNKAVKRMEKIAESLYRIPLDKRQKVL